MSSNVLMQKLVLVAQIASQAVLYVLLLLPAGLILSQLGLSGGIEQILYLALVLVPCGIYGKWADIARYLWDHQVSAVALDNPTAEVAPGSAAIGSLSAPFCTMNLASSFMSFMKAASSVMS